MPRPDVKVFIKPKPPLSKVKRLLSRRGGEIGEMEKPNRRAAVFLDRWVQRNFRAEGGLIGGWAPIRRDGRILQLTGRLRISFLPFADKKTAGIGSKLPYSKAHEEGIGVTRRRMLPKQSDVFDDLRKIYGSHVKLKTKTPLWRF